MELKNFIIGILVFFGALFVLYTLISVIAKVCFHVKKAPDSKNMQLLVPQKTSLRESLDFKIQMRKEETSNHEFDSSTTYNNKIKIGTIRLNEYKTHNGTLLSKEYTRMKKHE